MVGTQKLLLLYCIAILYCTELDTHERWKVETQRRKAGSEHAPTRPKAHTHTQNTKHTQSTKHKAHTKTHTNHTYKAHTQSTHANHTHTKCTHTNTYWACRALYFNHFVSNWGNYTLLTYLPKFLVNFYEICFVIIRCMYTLVLPQNLLLGVLCSRPDAFAIINVLMKGSFVLSFCAFVFALSSLCSVFQHEVLDFDMKHAGFIAIIPYVAMFAVSVRE